MGELVGETPQQNTVYVSRSVDRHTIEADDTSLQSLSDPALRWLQVVELTSCPVAWASRRHTPARSGSTSCSGAIEVDLNGSASTLAADDAVHFRADVPHALRNPHEEGATVLVVNSLESPSLHLGY